jgi:hypothetical protein
MSSYFTCPHCGAQVPSNATACPECGSDEETGWSENADYDEPFPYAGEPETRDKSTAWLKYLIAIVAALTLSAYLAYALPWGIYLIPVTFLAVGIGYCMTRVRPNRPSAEKQLYQSLLQKAQGDRDLVARLIEYERQRNPRADRLKLLQDALYRWERDSR